jgi:hypothetical protein
MKKEKGSRNMINDEKYISFLKQIIACISHGDYYAVKELSEIELEKMKKEMERNKK